jgi:phosphate transport system substrate-binding protein
VNSAMHHICVAAIALACGSAAAEDRIVLGGAGSMIPATKELAQAFQARNPGVTVELISEDIGTTGAVKALASGKLTLALATRTLKPDEKAGRQWRAIGRAPVVFAVNRKVSINGLKESELCDLFAGKVPSWKDVGGSAGAITLLTRNEDDGTKEAVRKNLSCFRNLQESPDAAVLLRSTAMLSRLRWEAGTIGMTQLDAVEHSNGALKALTLEGVGPSLEAVRSGKYKLVEEYALLAQGEAQGAARRFIDFAVSAEGGKILAANGVIPAN